MTNFNFKNISVRIFLMCLPAFTLLMTLPERLSVKDAEWSRILDSSVCASSTSFFRCSGGNDGLWIIFSLWWNRSNNLPAHLNTTKRKLSKQSPSFWSIQFLPSNQSLWHTVPQNFTFSISSNLQQLPTIYLDNISSTKYPKI